MATLFYYYYYYYIYIYIFLQLQAPPPVPQRALHSVPRLHYSAEPHSHQHKSVFFSPPPP